MPTLWEILTKKKKNETPLEFKFCNPLKARVGNSVKIDTPEYANMFFTIQSIRQVDRKVEGESHLFPDYDLKCQPFDGDPVQLRLRLIPGEPDGEIDHSVVLLKLIDECPYDKAFHDGLAFEENKGEFLEGDATYWRVNDVKEEWVAKTSLLQDINKNGKIDQDEVKHGSINYWDFWRETEEDGNKFVEFYIVEMDKDTGYFTFWIGRTVAPALVSVL
jgi:hypothetical protein